ncbi:MAG: DUF211 domain-containing protein [Thiomonas sp.]
MHIRRLVLDVDKAFAQPSLLDVAAAIDPVRGVTAFTIHVEEVDMETISTIITVVGDDIDYAALVDAIERSGAMVHGILEISVGDQVIDAPRPRKPE